MHTFNGKTCVIHHDGSEDGSGEGKVQITDKATGDTITIEAGDLFDFVGSQLFAKQISVMEQWRGRDFLYAQGKT